MSENPYSTTADGAVWPSTPTVATRVVRAHLLAARAAGVDIEALARRAACHLPPDEDGSRIPIDAFARLLHLTWDTLGCEAAGFTEQPLRPGLFTMMCHATVSCPNLRRALLRSTRFYSLVQDEFRLDLVERGDEALLYIHHQNRRGLDDRAFIEGLMVLWLRWSSWLIERAVMPDRIMFRYPPGDYADEYIHMFPCDHYFGAPANCVVFPARYLDHPILRTESELTQFLASAPESLMHRYIEEPSFSSTVRRMIRRSSAPANLGLEEVATAFNMSTQTLRRRLRDEGNGFQEIKDSVRKESAIEQLLNSDRSINQIAESIGFSEPSAFHRAFKKWTGIAPGAYRESNAEP